MEWTAKTGSISQPERKRTGSTVSVCETRGKGANTDGPGEWEKSVCPPALPDSAELALAQRLAAGDPEALNELIACYEPMLRRLIGRLCAWSADCDDLLQEVLLRAWERAGSYRGGSLAAWLRTIAIRRCRNHFRGLNALRRMLGRARLAAGKGTVRSHVTAVETSDFTRVALQQLQPADRTLLVLVYLEELSLAEVGETLGVRPKTVAVRLHRARERMKHLLSRGSEDRGTK